MLVGDLGGVCTESSVDMDDPSEDICVMEDSGRSAKKKKNPRYLSSTTKFQS